jgi:ribosomal protein L28
MNRVRAHRRYQPNLQKTTLELDGKSVKALVCTRCQRTLSRAAR